MSNKKEEILNQYNEKKSKNEGLCKALEELLIRLLKTNKITVNAIDSRVKEYSSLEGKIAKKRGKYNCIDDITDIVGSRIITYYSDDVNKIAEIIKNEFEIDQKNSIDKRKMMEPDRFGYTSLHYVCQFSENRTGLCEYSEFKDSKFEIQIRSILQHTWAEIEHDTGYKSEIEIPVKIKRNFSRLAGLLELADDEFNRIRNMLSDYQVEVSEKLKAVSDQKSEILIDRDSLNMFYDLNKDLKELDVRIAKSKNNKLSNRSVLELSIDQLKSLKINTIQELTEMINNNSERAFYLAMENLGEGERDDICRGIGLFYICYVEICEKSNSDDEIVKYFVENKIGLDTEAGNNAIELKELYYRCEQK